MAAAAARSSALRGVGSLSRAFGEEFAGGRPWFFAAPGLFAVCLGPFESWRRRNRCPISSLRQSTSPGRRRSAACASALTGRNRAGRAVAGPCAFPRPRAAAGSPARLPFGPRDQVPFPASSASRHQHGLCRRAWPDRPAVRDRSRRRSWNSSCRGADRRSRAGRRRRRGTRQK